MPYYDGNSPESPLNLPEPSSPQGAANHSLTHAGNSPYGAAVPVNALPPALAAPPDVMSLLKALKRHWLPAITLGLLAAVAASAAVWYLMPTKYTAEVMLTVSSSNLVKIGMGEKESPSPFARETLLALPRTPFVLQAAVIQPQIAKLASVREQLDPIGWLRSRLDVSAISQELMSISITGTDPRELEVLVDGVAHVYEERLAEAERLIRKSQVDKLTSMINKLQEFVNLRKQSYRELVNQIGAANSGQRIVKSEFDGMLLQYLLKEKVVEQQKLARLELSLQQMKNRKDGSPPHVPRLEIEKKLNEDKGFQSLTADIENWETYVAQAEQVYINKKHPKLEEARAKITKLEQRKRELRKKLIPEIRKKLGEYYAIGIDDTEDDTEAEITTTKMLINFMQSEMERLSESVKRQGSDSLDLDDKLAEFQTEQAVVNNLRDTKARVNALLQESVSTVQIKDKARSYPNVNVKKQIMMAGGAGGAALGLVLLAFAYLEFRLRRINTVEDVVYGLGWRLVGQLPALPERTRGLLRRRADPRYWQSLMTESVDATRTMILHAARVDGIRTVMVTSAVAGEGKTSLSCHLACSLARAGRKTLLLDCDLRNPAAHRLFDLQGEPGLCEVLRGEAQLSDVIRATPASNLWLIPAGQFDEQALQMLTLSQEGFSALLERLKTQFDFIVVDSSPVLPVVDSLVIGQNVDVVVFSLLRDVSRIPSVYAAYQRLATLDIHILGAVVNGVDAGTYGYTHRYYAKQDA